MLDNFRNLLESTKYGLHAVEEYCWTNYSNDAKFLEFTGNNASNVSAVLSLRTDEVYEITVHTSDDAYFYVHPDYRQGWSQEYINRQIESEKPEINVNTFADMIAIIEGL